MKSTATVSVAVLASVMICGCVAVSDDDFEQEDIGSIQRAATVGLGDWTIADCNKGLVGLNLQLVDRAAANATWKMCGHSTSGGQFPVIISSVTRVITTYTMGTGTEAKQTKRTAPFWYAVLKQGDGRFNDAASLAYPHMHRFFAGYPSANHVYNSAAGSGDPFPQSFPDYTDNLRTSECKWTMSQTAFKNKSAAIGKTIKPNCDNIVGFDPGTNLSPCAAGGWVC